MEWGVDWWVWFVSMGTHRRRRGDRRNRADDSSSSGSRNQPNQNQCSERATTVLSGLQTHTIAHVPGLQVCVCLCAFVLAGVMGWDGAIATTTT